MVRLAVVGGQHGEEGKGKAIRSLLDIVGGEDVMVVRFEGVPGKEHHFDLEVGEYLFNQVPSGIAIPDTYNVIGQGALINPEKLVDELKELRMRGVDISAQRFGITKGARVSINHPSMNEEFTLSIEEFIEEQTLHRGFVQQSLRERKPLPLCNPSLEYAEHQDMIREFVVSLSEVNQNQWRHTFYEGAQRPAIKEGKVTMPAEAQVTLAVVKAYETLPDNSERTLRSQMPEGIIRPLRSEWSEYGTNTNNPRRIGYFDAEHTKRMVERLGAQALVMTCIDRMSAFYKHGFQVRAIQGYDGERQLFEDFMPWAEATLPVNRRSTQRVLTKQAQAYVDWIEQSVGIPVIMVGTGPDKKNYILRERFSDVNKMLVK